MKQDFFQAIRLFRLNSVLVKTFFVFTSFFIGVMLLVNILVGQILSEGYRERENLTNLHALSQSCETLDTTMSYLANDMYITMWNKDIISMMVAPNHRTYEKDYAITVFFERIQLMSDFVDMVCLYLPNAGLIYTSTGVEVYLKEDSPGNKIVNTYRFDIRDFLVYHETDNTVTSLYCKDGMIYIAQKFSISGVLGTLFYVINDEELYRVIQENRQFAQEPVLIYDEKGKAVFGRAIEYEHMEMADVQSNAGLITSAEDKNNGNAYYSLQSNLLGWSFLRKAVNPGVIDNLTGILTIVVPIALLCFAVCLLLGTYVTYSVFKPVNNLLQYMLPGNRSDMDGVRNEYEFFHKQYAKMREKSQNLEERLENIEPEVVRELFFRLASGTPLSEEYIAAALQSVHSRIEVLGRFAVMAVQLQSPDGRPYQAAEMSMLMKNLRNVIEENISKEDRIISVQMEKDLFLIVFAFSSDMSVNKIKNTVLFFKQDLNNKVKNLPYGIITGRGDIHYNLADLFGAYQTALTDLNESSYRQDDSEDETVQNIYRKRVEKIAKIATENRKNAVGMSELLCDEAMERSASMQELQRNFDMIIDSFLERLIVMRIPSQDPVFISARFQEEHMTDANIMKNHIMAFCSGAIDFFNASSKKSSFKYIEAAKAYIEDHFTSSDLDLGSVAKHAGINISYCSKLFKEIEGQTFVEYLSAYRAEKAKQIIEATDLSVKEVGIMCGFNSPQNFIRVFKKYNGKTPGAYKGSYNKKN